MASQREQQMAPRLIQMSMEKAGKAMEAGNDLEAFKLYRSTEQLCDRVDAPPPLHALVARAYTDVLRKQGTAEYYAEGREVMKRTIAKCEAAEYREGIPKEFQHDLRGRMSDLLAAWGEMEREAGEFEISAQVLNKAVATFKRMGESYHFMAATQNRLAVTYIEAGDGEAALAALKRAEEYAESVPEHQTQLMQQTLCHRGSAYARLEQNEKSKEEFKKALAMAYSTGSEGLVSDITHRLGLLDGVDQAAASGQTGTPASAPGVDQFL